jgi:hypothetical protein
VAGRMARTPVGTAVLAALAACAAQAIAGCGQQTGPTAAAAGAAGLQRASAPPAVRTTPRPGPSEEPTLPPTARLQPGTVAQPAQAASYLAAVQVDAQRVIAANGTRAASCGTRDTAGCRAAFQTAASALATFQHDLDTHPAPVCLQRADASIRAALGVYGQGTSLGLSGLGAANTGQVIQGGGLMNLGTSQLGTASAQLRTATCAGNVPSIAP